MDEEGCETLDEGASLSSARVIPHVTDDTVVITKNGLRTGVVVALFLVLCTFLVGFLLPSPFLNVRGAEGRAPASQTPAQTSPSPQPGSLPVQGGPSKPGKTPTLAPPPSAPQFDLVRVQAVRKVAQELRDTLEAYYGGTTTARRMMLLGGWATPWVNSSHDSLMMVKMVDTMARALVDENQDTFIIGALGSSVVLGHGNCNYDNYVRQMQRTFAPVWEAAGMTLDAQNGGHGGECGDGPDNQVFCMQQNVSPFSDILHFSWTYYGDSTQSKENLVRWAQMLPRQPPVHSFSLSKSKGSISRSTCVDRANSFAHQYDVHGYNHLCMPAALYNGGRVSDSDDIFVNKHVGDGYHNITRYGEQVEDARRKASLGVVMRNWHPGPLGHQIVADSFAYVYNEAVLRALDLVEGALHAGEDPRKRWTSDRPHLFEADLPPPQKCNPKYCTVPAAPTCLSFEQPIHGWWGSKIADPGDNSNPYRGETQSWNLQELQEPVGKRTNPADLGYFAKRGETDEACAHHDVCGEMTAKSPDAGRLVLRLPSMSVGLVVLCGKGTDFRGNKFVEIEYNKVLLNQSTFDSFPSGRKCTRILAETPMNAMSDWGHSYLSVRILPGNQKVVKISQVITL
uniref:Uncharacterized protein n=1 Tax=Noctiluca scintillans TaxID=2966 RepID=A0A7S1AMZ6_NOCSC